MAFSTVATLGAGSILYFENPASPGVFKALPNALTIGEVGEQGEFVETTPISEVVRQYVKGLRTPPNKTLTFNDQPGLASYAEYLTLVDAEETVVHRVDYTNGHRARFSLVLNGRIMQDAEGGSQLKMNIFGQQSGATIWSEF